MIYVQKSTEIQFSDKYDLDLDFIVKYMFGQSEQDYQFLVWLWCVMSMYTLLVLIRGSYMQCLMITTKILHINNDNTFDATRIEE